MKITSVRETSLGKFTMRKLDKVAPLNCDHCKQEKTSKNHGELVTPSGAKKPLCNGCYGELLAKTPA